MFPLLFINNRKEVYFSDEEMSLFQQYFSHMPPATYFNMLSQTQGKWRNDIEAGTVLVEEGKILKKILLLREGSAESYFMEPGQTEMGPKPVFRYRHRMSDEELQKQQDNSGKKAQVRGCIIGGTALSETDVLGTLYPNRVVASTKCSYIEFDTESLLTMMGEDPAIQAAMYQCLYVDMLQVSRGRKHKIQEIKGNQMIQEYTTLMTAVLADGLVHINERNIIKQWRKNNPNLEDETHVKVILIPNPTP